MKGKRITLRPLSMDDLPDCTRWAGDPNVVRRVIQETKTPEEERVWLENVLKDEQQRVWLTVDTAHARAIRAYEKAGFSAVREMDAAGRIHSNGKQLLMETRYE